MSSLGALACTGVMDDKNPGGMGSAGTAGTSTMVVDPNAAKTQPVDPGYVDMHRLNTAEYNATVQDVLQTKLAPADANWRGGEIGGFDNMASVLGVDADQFERYFNAADAMTKEVFADPARASRILTCTTADDMNCVKSILDQTGLRIFRRPLTDEEVATYQNVYKAARMQMDDHTASVRLMVQALLSSAEFLYRIELDPNPATTDKHKLNPYELASRLSYFLWSSAPDDQLLAAAQSGTLLNDDTLSGAVDYMLASDKSNRMVVNFAGQWLGVRRVVSHPAAPEVYPGWNAQIADAASQEMYLYFNEFLRDKERSWLDFMTADINYVNSTLAKQYGMPDPNSAAPMRIQGFADNRTGFAGLIGFLAHTSPDRRSSPTLRGKWVKLNLLCDPPPDPPPNIPKLEQGNVDTSMMNVRQILEAHRSSPACAACHALIDPLGLALEKFDGVGNYRTMYANGSPVDDTTTLDGVNFAGIVSQNGMPGLADVVSQNPKFATCVPQKLMQYSAGRLLTDTDKPYLDVIDKEWLQPGAKPTLQRLVHGLVGAETFRSRRGEGT